MTLKNTMRRSACGLMGAAAILSIIYYGLLILRPHARQTMEYYSPSASFIASQSRGGSCSVPSYSPSPIYVPESQVTGGATTGNYAWDSYGPPWRLSQGNVTIGTLYGDGSFRNSAGEVVPCPAGWYPSGFDSSKLLKVAVPPEKTGDTDPKLFGVKTKELEGSLSKNTSHYYTTDGEGKVQSITRNDAFNSVGNPQLQSFYKGYNLAVIGIDAQARSEMVAAAKQSLPAGSNVTVEEYDPKKPADLWHIQANWNHALSHRPSLAQSGAVAYFTNGPEEPNVQREVMAWSPDEVTRFAKTITTGVRPDKGISNHDPDKAGVDQGLFGVSGWPLTTTQTYGMGLFCLLVALLMFTPKPPVAEEQ